MQRDRLSADRCSATVSPQIALKRIKSGVLSSDARLTLDILA
jgi:hypothetical protein